MLKAISNPQIIEPICEEVERPDRANNDWNYYCPVCNEIHATFTMALYCCQEEGEWYECLECGSIGDDFNTMQYCCQD